MKIQQHPRMKDILVGDEVLCHTAQLYARVEEVFPAAVCVRLMTYQPQRKRLMILPALWRADDIENLSICRYCGGREDLTSDGTPMIPFRVCQTCRTVLDLCHSACSSLFNRE